MCTDGKIINNIDGRNDMGETSVCGEEPARDTLRTLQGSRWDSRPQPARLRSQVITILLIRHAETVDNVRHN